MQRGFAEAAIGATHQVFGHKMRPLSAAHLLWLDVIDSPVLGGGPCTPVDLLIAAKICAAPIRRGNGGYEPDTKLRATIRDQWRLAWVLTSPKRFRRECEAWRAYCEDFLSTPELMATPGKTPKPLSAPALLAAVVMGLPHFGEERAWSMPFGLLRSCLDVNAEAQGADLRFEPDEKERAVIEQQLREAEEAGKKILADLEARKNL